MVVDDIDVDVAIWRWSWEVFTTVAPCERLHKRNHDRVNSSLRWANFAAKCVRQENYRRNLQIQKAMSDVRRRLPATKSITDGPKRHKTLRGFVKQDLLSSHVGTAQKVQITSSRFISELDT